jgi:two-component system chemotaxis response regulator CheY
MGKRILIVDDDADWREFLRFCLEDLGYEGVEARDGEQALALLRQERFSIILLDLNMPGIDGREVLRNLPHPAPRVVLLTSAGMDDLGDTLSSESCYYLPKDATDGALSLILDSFQE